MIISVRSSEYERADLQKQSLSVYSWDRHVYVITTSEDYYKAKLVAATMVFYNAVSSKRLLIPRKKRLPTSGTIYNYSGFVKAEMDGLDGRKRVKLMNLFIRFGVDLPTSSVLRGDISTS